MANGVNPDQTLFQEQSDMGLLSLIGLIVPNIEAKYSNVLHVFVNLILRNYISNHMEFLNWYFDDEDPHKYIQDSL